MTRIDNYNVPYPDLRDGEVLDASQFDLNYQKIVTKANEVITHLNDASEKLASHNHDEKYEPMGSLELIATNLNKHKTGGDHDNRYTLISTTDAIDKEVKRSKVRIDKNDIDIQSFQSQVNSISRGATNAETSQARVDMFGTTFTTLKARIDSVDKKLNNMVINVKDHGAKGDGTTDDSDAVLRAIAVLTSGCVLYFPQGNYRITKAIPIRVDNVKVSGSGNLIMTLGFRPLCNNITFDSLSFESPAYSVDSRAIFFDNSDRTGGIKYFKGLYVRNCYFKNFFYAVYASGGTYNPTGTESTEGYPVSDYVVSGCTSVTHEDNNAGHFQSIRVANVAYLNNTTYGGRNATSYNAINTNGWLRVLGNYDHNNLYGSCEVENMSHDTVISGNTFNKAVWLDDCAHVTVNGNTVNDRIFVSVGSGFGDGGSINITGNVCDRVYVDTFGEVVGGVIKHLNIVGNTMRGTSTNGIFIQGSAVEKVNISDNMITGTFTNDIAVAKTATSLVKISSNFGNNGKLTITGTEGIVYVYDNINFVSSGERTPRFQSHTELEFNGIRIASPDGSKYRIDVNNSGQVFTTKYV